MSSASSIFSAGLVPPRFVQQKHFGARAERPGDLETPPLAVRQRARKLVRPAGQADEPQELQRLESLSCSSRRVRRNRSMAPTGRVLLGLRPDLHVLEVVRALKSGTSGRCGPPRPGLTLKGLRPMTLKGRPYFGVKMIEPSWECRHRSDS